jgi:Big-like domain-containing protein
MLHRVLFIVAVVGQCACGSPSTVPTAPVVAGPTVTGVFVGPSPDHALVVGDQMQLTASVRFSNGNVKTGATTQAGWSSSNPAVLTVSSSGVVRIVAVGEADVIVTFQGFSTSLHLVAWPSGAFEVRGVVHSDSGVPVQAARVHVGGIETTSDLAGRFTVAVQQARMVGSAFAIHDDYEIGLVDQVRPQHLSNGVDLVLTPSPDRVYLRVRGHDVCTEHPRVADVWPLATFAVQHTGLVTFALPFTTPFTGSSHLLSRIPPVSGIPQYEDFPKVVDGGYTYTWSESPDYLICPQDYDMTIAHPR